MAADERARRGTWVRAMSTPTGQPPQWSLVGFGLAGLVLGLALGLAAQPSEIALLPALTAGLVATTGATGPSAVATRVAAFAAVATIALVSLGYATSGHPWAAAISMAAVAVFTSAAFGNGAVGGAIGVLATLAYVLGLVLSSALSARDSAGLSEVVVRVSLAAALGWLVVLLGSRWRERGQGPAPEVRVVPPWRAVWRSVATLDEHARDGVRRAVPLSACVLWYQATASHDALWVLVSALAVLLPTARSTVEAAALRVLATMLGVVVVALVAAWLPTWALVSVAVVALLLGLAYQPVLPVVAGAASAFAVVVLVGAPSGEVDSFAARRLIDTLAGCGIALASSRLPWPRDGRARTATAVDPSPTD